MSLPFFALTESGDRLLEFAHHGAFDWVNDRECATWEPVLQRLGTGGAEDPVDGDLDALWRCLLATFRADRFTEGLIATHQVALARLGNELRRRLSERISAGLHPPHEVRVGDGVVEAASAVRLPFEPPLWGRRFREALQGALGSLEPKEAHVLSAVYAAEHDPEQAVDAENVLFYNVGPGAFARLSTVGLRFERSFEPPFPDERAFFPLRHHHRYELVPKGVPFLHWEEETLLSCWDAVSLAGVSSSMKPAAAWWAMRQAGVESRPAGPDAVFGLSVRLHGPAARRSLAGVMKPLFDGVIAAFHGWKGTPDEEVASRLAAQLGVTQAEVARLLFDLRPNVLGPREVALRRGRWRHLEPGGRPVRGGGAARRRPRRPLAHQR